MPVKVYHNNQWSSSTAAPPPPPPASGGRGLSTAAPPGCPAYDTPATKTATPATLPAVLAGATAGDVIEVVSEPTTSITLTGGPQFTTSPDTVLVPPAQTKILIRPPLSVPPGTWYGSFRLNATNVVVAGFGAGDKKIGTSGQDNSAGGAPGSGCWFWRCGHSTAAIFFAIYDCDDAGFHSCWTTSTAPSESDYMQISANATPTRRPQVVSCWFAGRDRPAGSSKHVDTVQLYYLSTGEIWHPHFADSVIHGSANAGIQGSGFRGRFTLENCAVSKLSNHAVNVDTNVTPNGYYDLVIDSTIHGNLLHEYRPNAADTAFFDTTRAANSGTKVSGVYTYGKTSVPAGAGTLVSTGVNYTADPSEFPPLVFPW